MTPAAAPRRFTFDTVFAADGGATAPVRPQRAFSREELEAARAAAFAEGQGSAVARAEGEAAAALADLAVHLRAALTALAGVAHEHRSASTELALACGRAIAGAALDAAPQAPAQAALAALAREIEAAPRLTVSTGIAHAERLREALTRTVAEIGFPGAVAFKADPALAPCAFGFDWGDGRAAFDPAAAGARVAEALAAALAAEGLHGEQLALDLPPHA